MFVPTLGNFAANDFRYLSQNNPRKASQSEQKKVTEVLIPSITSCNSIYSMVLKVACCKAPTFD